MRAPGGGKVRETMHDRHARAVRKVRKRAKLLAGWLKAQARAVAAHDWEAAAGCERNAMAARAQLDRALRAERNAAEWARLERVGR